MVVASCFVLKRRVQSQTDDETPLLALLFCSRLWLDLWGQVPITQWLCQCKREGFSWSTLCFYFAFFFFNFHLFCLNHFLWKKPHPGCCSTNITGGRMSPSPFLQTFGPGHGWGSWEKLRMIKPWEQLWRRRQGCDKRTTQMFLPRPGTWGLLAPMASCCQPSTTNPEHISQCRLGQSPRIPMHSPGAVLNQQCVYCWFVHGGVGRMDAKTLCSIHVF